MTTIIHMKHTTTRPDRDPEIEKRYITIEHHSRIIDSMDWFRKNCNSTEIATKTKTCIGRKVTRLVSESPSGEKAVYEFTFSIEDRHVSI